MDDYVETIRDNGGVHVNSGIPNHAFYLAAAEIGGYAWEVTGRIWYEALRDLALRPDSGFAAFARLAVLAGERLHGQGSRESTAVKDAWDNVGVPTAPRSSGSSTRRSSPRTRRGRSRSWSERQAPRPLAQASPMQGRGADRFQYELTIEGRDGRHELVMSEDKVPDELRALMDRLKGGGRGA
jgi:Thermolysin metallopeptidase, alpha-helical domain